MSSRFNSENVTRRARGPLAGRLLRAALVGVVALTLQGVAFGDRLRMKDGTVVEVDEAWEDAQGVWYRRGGVTHLVDRARVKKIERAAIETDGAKVVASQAESRAESEGGAEASGEEAAEAVWIYLKGGAQMEVDEATETAEGVWYRRGQLSTFLAKERVERVERGRAAAEDVASEGKKQGRRREHPWTTGSRGLDALIRQNGARHGVDPSLIFCVMAQESSFHSRALSPTGARGLMQLMPGTAARFGVRNISDPAQNISGGTRYLKTLLKMFNGRVDLVLAGYNAGEGAVQKYGGRVPPYRETRNYVRRISARYQRGA
ncbi:MAG TPA: lytic transglycosylase domain-containing protein [Pyrinomonadaceae bacterium]|nr:lytic transglycosylase domain-containing protein [Pyrinomonadaceae bacterium]